MIEQVSYSSVALWLKCPKLWEYTYVHKVGLPPSTSTILGICYHKALQANYQQKIASHEDLPIYDVFEIYSKELTHLWKTNPPRVKRGWFSVNMGILEAQELGGFLLGEYMTAVAPSTQPAEVEAKHYSEIAGIKFVVKPDLITTSGIVIDHKTTKTLASYSNAAIRLHLQPSAIAFGLDKQIVFHYHIAVKGTDSADEEFRRQYIHVAKTHRLHEDIARWRALAEKAVAGMKSGIAPPKFPNCENCFGIKYCRKRERKARKKGR